MHYRICIRIIKLYTCIPHDNLACLASDSIMQLCTVHSLDTTYFHHHCYKHMHNCIYSQPLHAYKEKMILLSSILKE